MVILPRCRCCKCDCPFDDYPYLDWWMQCTTQSIYATVTISVAGCDDVVVNLELTRENEDFLWEAFEAHDSMGSGLPEAEGNRVTAWLTCPSFSYGETVSEIKDKWFFDFRVRGDAGDYSYIPCGGCAGGGVAITWAGFVPIDTALCACPEFDETEYQMTATQNLAYCYGPSGTEGAPLGVTVKVSLSFTP